MNPRQLPYALLSLAFAELGSQYEALVSQLPAGIALEVPNGASACELASSALQRIRPSPEGNLCFAEVLEVLRVPGPNNWEWTPRQPNIVSARDANEAEIAVDRLLYELLIGVRADMLTRGNPFGFAVADVFHNIPLQLAERAHDHRPADDVLEWMRQRASRRGIESWLEARINQVREALA